jgi:outer membrane protein OmpA-like peptidoglycan-associated protein
MMTLRSAARGLAALALVAVTSCAGSALKDRTRSVDTLIAEARDNGAIRCAPVELAMAESHNEFAQTELRQGHFYPARTELEVAETNAKAAVAKSPKDRCNPSAPIVKGPGDLDGDGILDNVDECPKVPEDKDGFQDEDGCPELDNDADGIADTIDKCPNDPEDKDGFEDDDGCPDPDNDKDGITDKIDQCPDEAEDKDGFEDDDGCPDCDNDKDGVPECPEAKDKCPDQPAPNTIDGCPQKYQLIVVTETKIELKQTVYFDTNKATIKAVSFPLLNEVAQALADNPKIAVRVEGHTDSQGNDAFNMKLSQRRAESVRTYLVGKGVAVDRMDAQGFGETVPIADNRTGAGRAQNRRVEFVITAK